MILPTVAHILRCDNGWLVSIPYLDPDCAPEVTQILAQIGQAPRSDVRAVVCKSWGEVVALIGALDPQESARQLRSMASVSGS